MPAHILSRESVGVSIESAIESAFSNPIPLRQESKSEINTSVEPVVEETSSQINIPLFEHDESANDSAESHARTFSENYLEV